MNAPSFRVEKKNDGSMFLHYYSDRSGFYHIVPGVGRSRLSPVFGMVRKHMYVVLIVALCSPRLMAN